MFIFLSLYLKRLIAKGKQHEKELYQEELKGNQVTFFSYHFLFVSRNKRFADGKVSEINFAFYYLSSTLPLFEYMRLRHIHSEEKKVLQYVFFFFSFSYHSRSPTRFCLVWKAEQKRRSPKVNAVCRIFSNARGNKVSVCVSIKLLPTLDGSLFPLKVIVKGQIKKKWTYSRHTFSYWRTNHEKSNGLWA